MHAAAGRHELARRKLDEPLERGARAYVPPYDIALIHAGLGDTGAAMRWLQRALAERDVHMVFLRDYKWDSLRALRLPRAGAQCRTAGRGKRGPLNRSPRGGHPPAARVGGR